MALPPAFLDELRARTPLAALVGRRVRLQKSGRNSRGCCPFHNERTPSFYVYQDGFHCFGCGAHGDAISFVMQTQGASFPEAVAALAAEAGLEVPRPSPTPAGAARAEAERRRLDHVAVLEAAQRGFRRRLEQPGGAAARDYLARRGVTAESIAAWGLGWSGPGRGDLAGELAGEGITPAMMAEAGLTRVDDTGAPAGELFFNRLTFPIRDGRGRVIGFGGRVLGDGQPKYLNGPETELFSKRRALFGLDLAKAAARAGGRLVIVEGYLDVIALHQAGLAAAVAPLGTALTEEQLALAWSVAPTPVLCFDGDAAGGRATARAAELALPLLTPDRSLELVRLPEGEDPDSLARRDPERLRALLGAPVPLARALYDLAREQSGEATPEARARLRRRLGEMAGRIGDPALSREFRSDLLDRFFADRRLARASTGAARVAPRHPVAPRTPPDPDLARVARWERLLGLVLRRPALLRDVHEALGLLTPPPRFAALQAALLELPVGSVADLPLDTAEVMNHLRDLGLADAAEQALRSVARLLPPEGSTEDSPALVEENWWHFFGLMDPTRLDDEIERARLAPETYTEAAAFRRLTALVAARRAMQRGVTSFDDET